MHSNCVKIIMLINSGRGGEWCGAWPGPWTPPGTTPATCSGPTSRPSRWVKLRIRAQIDYSDSDLGRRIVFVRPNLKSLPGKIQPQERSQNFTSAAVALESSSKTSLPVSCFLLLFLRPANAYLYLLHTWISCLLLVRSLKRTAEKNWANIFTEPIFKIFFIATTAKSVHISDGQLGPCGTDWNRKTVPANAGSFIVAHIVKYLLITRFEWSVVKQNSCRTQIAWPESQISVLISY